ncbi:hypothetical protein DFH07DRAFT_769861 [Mycena maculata]|uniref:Glucose-methanol-choline oxidoreductase C-terminal domain-containing protein n=1 Tax=Mycena maculata TaxID=230809 RepID=A0AAD7JMZ4_9AGAR|nr:hypothetical protein DFH07DRAFT_769861 [Mycena maculata]
MWPDFLKSSLSSTWHTIGSCSMLPLADGGGLTVYNTTNIRVVDVSVFPLHIGAHLQATAYAPGELGGGLRMSRCMRLIFPVVLTRISNRTIRAGYLGRDILGAAEPARLFMEVHRWDPQHARFRGIWQLKDAEILWVGLEVPPNTCQRMNGGGKVGSIGPYRAMKPQVTNRKCVYTKAYTKRNAEILASLNGAFRIILDRILKERKWKRCGWAVLGVETCD